MAEEAEPHVILYFDVNKVCGAAARCVHVQYLYTDSDLPVSLLLQTVIMHDPVQGKDLAHILNDLLTERARGSVTRDGGEAMWTWNGRHVLTDADETGDDDDSDDATHVSYGRFLRAQYPMSSDPAIAKRNKRLRKLLRQGFTSAGNAGEALAGEHQALLKKLQLPFTAGDAKQRRAMQAAGLIQQDDSGEGDGTPQYFFIVPAFFRLLQHLHARNTRFNLVFRTYGDDLARIAQEFNCFCEGRHPFFQLSSSRMDGSDGGVDRRIHLSPPVAAKDDAHSHRFGTFLRSDELTALVMGTFKQPNADDKPHDLTFYEPQTKLHVISGFAAIHEFLTHTWREQQATLAIRDFYPFWFCNCEDARAGKLMTVDPSDDDVHVVFFDDNILPHEPHIVDARDARDGTSLGFFETTKDRHLLRVEPLEIIYNDAFFIERFNSSLENRKTQRVVVKQQTELLEASFRAL